MAQPSESTMFGMSLHACAASQCARDLDAVEIFSGVRSIQRACVRRGLRAEFLDKLASPLHDVTKPDGFAQGVNVVLRVKIGGLMTVAPHCGSFVPACQNNHERGPDNFYYGNTAKDFVLEGNIIADAATFYLKLGSMRGLYVVVENPPASTIWKYPPMRDALEEILCQFEADVRRCAYDLGRNRIGKSFKFKGNFQSIELLAKPCTCIHPHKLASKQFIQQDTGRAKKVGQIRWTGVKSVLKESGSYPVALGECLVGCWNSEDVDQLFAAPRVPIPQHLLEPTCGRSSLNNVKSLKKPAAAPVTLKRPAAAAPFNLTTQADPLPSASESGSGSAGPSWMNPAAGAPSDSGPAHPDVSQAQMWSWLTPPP